MIDIVERPSETGKLIHLNPRDWKCPRQIEEALFTEEHAPEDYGQYDKPSQYPAGTVAELRRTGRAFTQYIMKQDDGRWRKLTPPFSYFSGDLPMAGLSAMPFTLTILYKPNNDQPKETTPTAKIIQTDNTDIGKQMSIHPEWFHKMPFGDLVSHIANEVTPNNFHEYQGTIHNLPVGTTIQVQFPCSPTMHFVKQSNDTWTEITINASVDSEELLSDQYSLVTIIYMPQ